MGQVEDKRGSKERCDKAQQPKYGSKEVMPVDGEELPNEFEKVTGKTTKCKAKSDGKENTEGFVVEGKKGEAGGGGCAECCQQEAKQIGEEMPQIPWGRIQHEGDIPSGRRFVCRVGLRGRLG